MPMGPAGRAGGRLRRFRVAAARLGITFQRSARPMEQLRSSGVPRRHISESVEDGSKIGGNVMVTTKLLFMIHCNSGADNPISQI